jgi:hypothetical protein
MGATPGVCAARGRSSFSNLRGGQGVNELARFIEVKGGLYGSQSK